MYGIPQLAQQFNRHLRLRLDLLDVGMACGCIDTGGAEGCERKYQSEHGKAAILAAARIGRPTLRVAAELLHLLGNAVH